MPGGAVLLSAYGSRPLIPVGACQSLDRAGDPRGRSTCCRVCGLILSLILILLGAHDVRRVPQPLRERAVCCLELRLRHGRPVEARVLQAEWPASTDPCAYVVG